MVFLKKIECHLWKKRSLLYWRHCSCSIMCVIGVVYCILCYWFCILSPVLLIFDVVLLPDAIAKNALSSCYKVFIVKLNYTRLFFLGGHSYSCLGSLKLGKTSCYSLSFWCWNCSILSSIVCRWFFFSNFFPVNRIKFCIAVYYSDVPIYIFILVFFF